MQGWTATTSHRVTGKRNAKIKVYRKSLKKEPAVNSRLKAI